MSATTTIPASISAYGMGIIANIRAEGPDAIVEQYGSIYGYAVGVWGCSTSLADLIADYVAANA